MSGVEAVAPPTTISNWTKHAISFEINWTHSTGTFKQSQRLDHSSRVKELKKNYQVIEVESISAELRQDTLLGQDDDYVLPGGHLFIALIPSAKNSEAAVGTSAEMVNAVPNKFTFPMSSVELKTFTYKFDLSAYELDLAQDPRRGSGIVLWTGNSGLRSNIANEEIVAASVTWRVQVACSGPSVLW